MADITTGLIGTLPYIIVATLSFGFSIKIYLKYLKEKSSMRLYMITYILLPGLGFLIMSTGLLLFSLDYFDLGTFLFQFGILFGLTSTISVLLMASVLKPRLKVLFLSIGFAIVLFNTYTFIFEKSVVSLIESVLTPLQLVSFTTAILCTVAISIVFMITGYKIKNRKYLILGAGLFLVGFFTITDAFITVFVFGFIARIGILIGSILNFYSDSVKEKK